MALRPKVQFFSGWFCPYAQRAWIALNHCNVEYDIVEGLLLDNDDAAKAKGYKKDPKLLEANPHGLVPTIVEPGQPPIFESLVTVEYASDQAAASGAPQVMPSCPAERARARMRAEWANRNICSPFYNILVRKDQQERQEAFGKLQANLTEWVKEIKGPLYFGDTLSLVDIAVFPWIYRLIDCKVVETFRGWSLDLEPEVASKLDSWHAAMLALPSVQGTLAPPAKLRASYQRYADGTAMSKVAEAVRQGAAAHDEKGFDPNKKVRV
eukprot:TRINITY_DN43012_c0_g1_i1.p1 TRINITY_DN43012_c0_g1~~TRINITY_DN43012_c0_g1_i1.p1  ORF type:complete len:267 (+),score=52.17 TRINITY_DN43012_c0_g1_i1:46-846(+)